jgi:precorrin-6B methylase 2
LKKLVLNEKIPGWMTTNELKVISVIARDTPENGIIVEIGSYAGRSSFHWLVNSKSTVKFICVDPFNVPIDMYSKNYMSGDLSLVNKKINSRDLFHFYTKKFKNRIEVIEQKSPLSQWDNLADVIFIDGDHSTSAVLDDLTFWYYKLKTNGRILGHDSNMLSVIKALNIFGKKWKYYPNTTIWEIIK